MVDFRKVFLTLLVIFIAALRVAFMSIIIRSPVIVIGYIVVSSLFFRGSLAPPIVSSNICLRRFKGGRSKSTMAVSDSVNRDISTARESRKPV